MTMNDIPEASTTWCDPDQIGAPLPETDEVEADPQTVQIPVSYTHLTLPTKRIV